MTKKELQFAVYKAVSGEFENLSHSDAAKKLGVTKYKIVSVLKAMKISHAKSFPMLTKREAEVRYFRNVGAGTPQIAQTLGVTDRRVQQIYEQLEAKGRGVPPTPKTVRYDPSMDSHIKQKF